MIKKSLSQNFLIDENVLKKIHKIIPDLSQYSICEIGPGKGALTKIILQKNPKKLTLIEKDINLYKYLMEQYPNIDIENKDILDIEFHCDIIISSIPYSISRDIMKKIVFENIEYAYLIVQKEFAEKLYKDVKIPISIFTKTFYEIEKIFQINSHSFYPQPKVDSYFIRIIKKQCNIKNKNDYWNWLNKLTSRKNRKLKNTLKIDDKRRLLELSYNEIKDLYVNRNIHTY